MTDIVPSSLQMKQRRFENNCVVYRSLQTSHIYSNARTHTKARMRFSINFFFSCLRCCLLIFLPFLCCLRSGYFNIVHVHVDCQSCRTKVICIHTRLCMWALFCSRFCCCCCCCSTETSCVCLTQNLHSYILPEYEWYIPFHACAMCILLTNAFRCVWGRMDWPACDPHGIAMTANAIVTIAATTPYKINPTHSTHTNKT